MWLESLAMGMMRVVVDKSFGLRWSLLANADAKLKEARRMPTSPVRTPRTLVYIFTFNHSLLSIHHFFCSEDLLVSSPQSKGLVLRGYDL